MSGTEKLTLTTGSTARQAPVQKALEAVSFLAGGLGRQVLPGALQMPQSPGSWAWGSVLGAE